VGPPPRQRSDPLLLLRLTPKVRTVRSILRTAHRDPEIQGRPLVSVVLSTYNWSSVLRHSVRSVLWQTYPNLELLVIGDACTDDSEQVVASFGDERVRWHNLEENSGSQAAPNGVGLELAMGDYVAYQGHDDVWHPRHLAALVSCIQRGRADLAYCLAEVIGPPGSRVRFLTGGVRGADLAPGTWLPPASVLHRPELAQRAGGWRTWEDGGGPPDVTFLARALEAGARPIRVPALTTFKFPAAFRANSYRDRPSHEQAAYVRRIERERLFIERELVALGLRRLSPRKGRVAREEPTALEMLSPKAQYAYQRRVKGLD
jgi:glycosyltransferase involved in cell wall biosynthesis